MLNKRLRQTKQTKGRKSADGDGGISTTLPYEVMQSLHARYPLKENTVIPAVPNEPEVWNFFIPAFNRCNQKVSGGSGCWN
jgi:hypothetical protein